MTPQPTDAALQDPSAAPSAAASPSALGSVSEPNRPSKNTGSRSILRLPRKIARRILGRDRRQEAPPQDPNIYPLF